MDPTKEDDKELYQWLDKRPSLRSELQRLRRLEEDREDLDLSALEPSTREVVRAIGRDSFEQTLQCREASAFQAQKKPGDRLHGKKLNFKSLFGNICVEEQLLRRGSVTVRPLALLLHLHPRGQTLLLQSMAVDFAAEGAFEGASKRLLRHHFTRTQSASGVRRGKRARGAAVGV